LIADLFSGLGTFLLRWLTTNFPGAKVWQAARNAFSQIGAGFAKRSVHSMHRSLFRNPLQLDELNRFDAVLDPRAGAKDQVALLAQAPWPGRSISIPQPTSVGPWVSADEWRCLPVVGETARCRAIPLVSPCGIGQPVC
jgi:hypothetical protein